MRDATSRFVSLFGVPSLAIAFAALSSGVFAAETMNVDELVRRYVAARGGAERIAAIASVRTTAKVIMGAGDSKSEGEQAELVARGDRTRSEFTLQGMTSVSAYDGREGWSVSPFGGRRDPERMSAEDAKGMIQAAEIDGPLFRWKEKGHVVEYLGTGEIDGVDAYKLRVERKDGDTQYIFLDPDVFLEIRRMTVSRRRGAESRSETDFGNYERVDGVMFPFSVESGAPDGGPRWSHVLVERIETHVQVDDALFRYPTRDTPAVRSIFSGPAPARKREIAAPKEATAGPGPVRLNSGALTGLGIRNIGPAVMSGRITSLACRTDKGKTTIYVGAASGGVWKSIDSGTTFRPVFDKASSQSIGALAIDPSNPRIVWAGTGETWTRNSVSIGDGIYKSVDAGETWQNMGLPESERIDRVIVHPQDGETVYVCVTGKLWSDSPERGVYKTTDGGKSWTKVLAGANASAGCGSLAMDPTNPNLLYAGMWDFRRKGWTFRSGGETPDAPSGSGLFRSIDAGASWAKLDATSAKGLPAGPWGRVEIVVAPSNPKQLYAFIEAKDSALYASADGGATWEERDRSSGMVWRPFYFARLVVDPTNPDRLFKMGGGLIVSDDGGKSFTYAGGGAHGDWHDLWIDPGAPQHLVGGDDGGLWQSFEGGNRWWKTNNLPIAQFYHVSIDEEDPYRVYGGLQDNSSWVGDSAFSGGLTNSRWENLYGGDGFWVHVDPTDPGTVYAESQGGYIGRIDRKTHSSRDIQPTARAGEKLRFNWNTPIRVSKAGGGTLYLGAQFLFRSRDKGETWDRISPDLTTNDPEKQKQEQSGGVSIDNSSAEMHTTIVSICESPKNVDVIWVGTDDGAVQLTRDGGRSWTLLTPNIAGLPPNSWVSWIEASAHAAATAYATFDRHTFGDMTPWVYRTTDFGASWTRIVSPAAGVRGYAHVVREDPVVPAVLYLGTEFGLWISIDGGGSWLEFKGGNFPRVAVRDIAIHPRENDLVLATHGRGIWILDDLTPLRALAAVVERPATILPGRPVQQRMAGGGGWVEGDNGYYGENPTGGATINYYLRARHTVGPLKIEILDATGKVVDDIPPTKRRGINRVTWSMRAKAPRVPKAAAIAGSSTQGPRLVPGTYTVRLTAGSEVLESKLEVGIDRRASYGVADRQAQFDAATRIGALFGEMSNLVDRIDATRSRAETRRKALPAGDSASAALEAFVATLDEIKKKIVATKEGGAITGEERIREHLDILYGAITNWEGRPTAYQLDRIEALRLELGEVAREFSEFLKKELPQQ